MTDLTQAILRVQEVQSECKKKRNDLKIKHTIEKGTNLPTAYSF